MKESGGDRRTDFIDDFVPLEDLAEDDVTPVEPAGHGRADKLGKCFDQ